MFSAWIDAAPGSQNLTDEQKSALKQNTDPVQSQALRLSADDMRWWRDARVGMFIHWGLYAVPAEGEWVMHNKKIPAAEYAGLADKFTASKFDAAEWAGIARAGGMRYVVLTARHHDGFSLWDSPSSYGHFTSMNSAAHRDIVAEYVQAVRQAGLKVGLYYSPMDWRFPAYFRPLELPENARLMKRQTYGQIEELMSKFGDIDILWYDGAWLAHQGSDADAAWLWDPIKLNTMVRKYQPNIVISPRSGWEGDFRCEEGGGEITGAIRDYAWEKCLSLSGSAWGYTSRRFAVPPEDIIRQIVNAAMRDGNILLNVGPDPEGVIPPEQVERMAEIGTWLSKFGESIYRTRGGPFQPVDGIYGSTYRSNHIYLHLLQRPERKLEIPVLPGKLLTAKVLTGGKVKVNASPEKTTIDLTMRSEFPPDTIIDLELDRPVTDHR